MTTIAPGQLITPLATANGIGRVWRIERPATPSALGQPRWHLTLIEAPPHDRARSIGSTATASLDWMENHCRDYTVPTIDPPCGDGIQVVRIRVNGEHTATERFDTAAAMLQWTHESLAAMDDAEPADTLVGEWYGWDGSPQDPPDMIVTIADGELVWAEA